MVVALILSYDVVLAFRDEHGDWGHMGLGTVVLLVNVVLIWLYTLSCHSCRHAVGGRLRHFSKHPVRYRVWTLVSRLNASHARYAWLSLFSVAIWNRSPAMPICSDAPMPPARVMAASTDWPC